MVGRDSSSASLNTTTGIATASFSWVGQEGYRWTRPWEWPAHTD